MQEPRENLQLIDKSEMFMNDFGGNGQAREWNGTTTTNGNNDVYRDDVADDD